MDGLGCWEFGVCGRSELYIIVKETDKTGRKYPYPDSIRNFGVNDGLNKSCVQRERQRCHQRGEEYFNDNVLKFMAVDALWFTGSMNTVYGIITGASLWSVKRIAGPAGMIAGVLWGVRRAALEGDRIEKECEEKIPEKCRNGCSS